MRIHSLIAATALLALAACGSGEKKGEEGGSSLLGGDVKLRPGEWEMSVETLNVSAPNLPPAFTANMKQPKTVVRDCMTPEEAAGPKPETFAGKTSQNCKQEGFTWSGGRIKGTTTCTAAGGAGTTTMTMDGQYSAESMDMTMKMTTEAQGNPITIETRMTGRRVGECPAGKAG